MNKYNNKRAKEHSDEEEQVKLLNRINERLRASIEKRDVLGMPSIWTQNEKYWAGEVNLPVNEEDVGSETNIIQPVIESQVAELVDGQLDILVKGVGPSDQDFSKDVQHILNFVWRKNKMVVKMDENERDRLNLGTSVWKVYWDPDALRGRGLPIIEPVKVDSFFPDARIDNPRKINDGDYCIEIIPMTLRQVRKMFGDRGKLVKGKGLGLSNETRVFNNDGSTNQVMMDQISVILYWEKDDDDKLRRVYCTEDVILSDSFDKKDNEASESFYKHGRFPYVMIPCYLRNGKIWGMSDTEQLIPTQDMINELDDIIRTNARLTANNQIVVSTGSGINIKKWTNRAGLKIPSKDVNGWKQVIPYNIPSYVQARREKGFQESELISGRYDISEGRSSGSLRAAAAVLAMQEAGGRRTNHKKLMNQEGFSEVLELILDYVKEFMTEEQAFDITENGTTSYMWFRGSDLTQIPWKTLNENFDPTSNEPNTDLYKNLYEEKEEIDEEGNPVTNSELMTKDAEFDLEISLGAGMPNTKSFLYQATLELMRENIITQQEARACLKQLLNWPIIDPYQPQGTFAGRNSSDEQLDIANNVPPTQPGMTPEEGNATPQAAQPAQQASNPQVQQVIQQALAQLPPDVAQTLQNMIGGMSQ